MILEQTPKHMKHSVQFYNCQTLNCLMQNYSGLFDPSGSSLEEHQMSQLMRLWYLSHWQPAKAQASLRICRVSPEPSLFAHMKYESRRRVRPKIKHLAPLDGCPYVFEEWVYGGRKVPQSHDMARILFFSPPQQSCHHFHSQFLTVHLRRNSFRWLLNKSKMFVCLCEVLQPSQQLRSCRASQSPVNTVPGQA